ncbi:MAG: hypothetical protein IJ542_00485 [Clostridia bacterium]|nr:hypothetical protein [Clostridia bacterium]
MVIIKYDDLNRKFSGLAERYFVASRNQRYEDVSEARESIKDLLKGVSKSSLKLLYKDSLLDFDHIFSVKQKLIPAQEIEKHCIAQTKIFLVEDYLSKEDIKDVLNQLKEKKQKERE